MKIPFRIFLAFFCFFTLSFTSALAGPLEDCAEYAKYGIPSEDGKLLCRTGYLLAHDGDFKTPIWVAEHLTKEKILEKLPRKDSFRPDPDLSPGSRAELADYKGSGFDRGHMAPNADFGWSAEAQSESFLLSNMVPQNPNNNQRIWAALEGYVRDWAIARGEVFVYSGPVYIDDKAGKSIGKNEVGVPDFLYKVIFDPKKKEAIAFLMPNEALDPNDLAGYIIPVRDIEYVTGLNFLSKLPRKEQNRIEKVMPAGMWGVNAPSSEKSETNFKPVEENVAVGDFHGNTSSHKFHRPGCKDYDCKSCTQIFKKREEALSAGYTPCGICKP